MKLLKFIAFLVFAPFSLHAQTADICALLQKHEGWSDALQAASDEYGVSPGSIAAFIDQESRFRANASNHANYGYAQATARTFGNFAREEGIDDPDRGDFAQATRFVGWHFKKMHQKFGIDMDDVGSQYMAYQLGEGGFMRFRENGGSKSALAKKISAHARLFDDQLESCD